MKDEDLYNGFSEEIKKKLKECKTEEEANKVLSEAGVMPLDDEALDDASGGLIMMLPWLLSCDDEEEKPRY